MKTVNLRWSTYNRNLNQDKRFAILKKQIFMHFRFLYVFEQLFLGLATIITPTNVYFVGNKKTPVQLAVLQNNSDYYICAVEMTIWIYNVTYNSDIWIIFVVFFLRVNENICRNLYCIGRFTSKVCDKSNYLLGQLLITCNYVTLPSKSFWTGLICIWISKAHPYSKYNF